MRRPSYRRIGTALAACDLCTVEVLTLAGLTRYLVVFVIARETRRVTMALLHESSLDRTRPTDRILTCRCDTTLVGRGRSSD